MTLDAPGFKETRSPLAEIHEAVVRCRACPRLVEWREEVARAKRAAYRDEVYWGRPVPGFGDPRARLLIVGLAPGAHGANRTGRMFTGDRSGEWLYRALHRAGFASRPDARTFDDGLALTDAYVTAALRCVPPRNRPTVAELDRCRSYLEAEFAHFLPRLRCVVALGRIAFERTLRALGALEVSVGSPRPKFAHGTEAVVGREILLLASYHPSQQNTFTGRLTREAFDAVWTRAREALAPDSS